MTTEELEIISADFPEVKDLSLTNIRDIMDCILKQLHEKDVKWHNEISKYVPQIRVVSFFDPKIVLNWLFNQVELRPEQLKLANEIRRIQASDLSESQKSSDIIEVMFPKLKKPPK